VGFVMFRCLVFSGSNRNANLTMAETSFKLEHPLGSFSFPFVSSVFFFSVFIQQMNPSQVIVILEANINI
jgi:hypothetical protein